MKWYDDIPYWISIPVSDQIATSDFSIDVTYTWHGSLSNEYTLVVYS
jgi:hypothetical protein